MQSGDFPSRPAYSMQRVPGRSTTQRAYAALFCHLKNCSISPSISSLEKIPRGMTGNECLLVYLVLLYERALNQVPVEPRKNWKMRIRRHIEEAANSDSTSLKYLIPPHRNTAICRSSEGVVQQSLVLTNLNNGPCPLSAFLCSMIADEIFFRLRNRRRFPLAFGT